MIASSHPLALIPAWLFCPADRPDRYAKAAERSDVTIIDLEDAVAAGDKEAARQALVATALDPTRTVVRVNPADSPERAADLAALARTDYRYVMAPKVESPSEVADLVGYDVIALTETAAGVLAAPEIARQPNVVGLMWGAEDLIADLGGESSTHPDGTLRHVALHARSTALLAGRAAGKFVLDTIVADIADLDGLAARAADAVASGFTGLVSIHPNQVPVVRRAFTPSAEKLAWARGVLAAAEGAQGAFAYEGAMVDAPLLKQAQLIIARAKD